MTPEERFRLKRQAYIRTFCGAEGKLHPEAQQVMADLHKFCRMNRSGLVVSPQSVVVDSHATVHAVGLRDVYLRIAGFIGLSESLLTEENENGNAQPDPEPFPLTDAQPDA